MVGSQGTKDSIWNNKSRKVYINQPQPANPKLKKDKDDILYIYIYICIAVPLSKNDALHSCNDTSKLLLEFTRQLFLKGANRRIYIVF